MVKMLFFFFSTTGQTGVNLILISKQICDMWEDAPQTALLNEILEQADVGGCELCSLFMVEKM